MLDDFRIGNADIFRDQERRGAHHRRHQLTVDARSRFDRPGLHRRIADALHQGNCESAGHHRIGDRGAGNHSGHAGGDDAGFGRPAAKRAQHREGKLDEIVSGAGFFQQAAEQHEEEHHVGGDAERHPENAFRGEPHLRCDARERRSLMPHHSGQPGPCENIGEHQGSNDGERRPDGAPCGFEQ